ncbi:MAG: flippase [bacterium]|jgi:O-antigen/teichoic acid export membrane protein
MAEVQQDQGIGRRITRYGTILAVTGILCKILLLIYTVWAVDVLGKEGFGRIEYFIEMAIIFTVLVDFGMEQTITRELARRREELPQLVHPLMLFRLLVTIGGAILMALFLRLTAKPEHTWLLIGCAILYYFIVSHVMLIRAYVRSCEWLGYEGTANLLDKMVHIGLAFAVLWLLPSLPLIMLCYSAGALVSLLIYIYVIIRHLGWKITPFSLSLGITWQALAVPIGLSAACILLLHRQDTAMVNWIRGDEETGLYRAPYRFLEGLFLFPQVLAIAAYPVFSKLFHEQRPFIQTAADLLRGLFMLSLPITIGGTMVAADMMHTLTPELGTAGGWVFMILLWSLPFIYANFLLGTILNATDRQRDNLIASAAGLICNAVLNIPAIFLWGAYGASITTVLSQGMYCLIMFAYLRHYSLIQGVWSYSILLLSCVVMALVLYLVEYPWFIEVLIGAAVYCFLMVSLRGITLHELKNLKRVVSKN